MIIKSRRKFLRLATDTVAATATLALLPASIRNALAIPATSTTGTINDVQHVVILMQENRSFDHYFGTLRGVRGFADRHPIPLANGATVWQQMDDKGQLTHPFHLDTRVTSAQRVPDLPHNWQDSQAAANHGRWDQWISNKTPLTMGHYRRVDIPFQFALAEAFTICDAYHCSIYGSTTPNRAFLMSGTNDPGGLAGGPAIDNSSSFSDESIARLVKENPEWAGFFRPRYSFTTYPERLENAGIRWKAYQEDPSDNANGTLNGLMAFKKFAEAPKESPLWKKGMARWTLGQLKEDVLSGSLPQVSWITAPATLCEHPDTSSPIQGAKFASEVIEALTANPEVWSRTVLFLMFDEPDGFFDHVPPPAVPSLNPDGSLAGLSTVDISTEVHGPDKLLYGLGPRVPMYVISPWSKGGWVNSEVFDHTSVIRFLERRFGVIEPNISAWRRAVCGDLTSTLDFKNPNRKKLPLLPDTSQAQAVVDVQSKLPVPTPPPVPGQLYQEPGARPSRSLPYELHVMARVDSFKPAVSLVFGNTGKAGAVFHVYDRLHLDRIPRRYTVEAGKTLQDSWGILPANAGRYDLWVCAPNGFVRTFKGKQSDAENGAFVEIALHYDVKGNALILKARNLGKASCELVVKANAYRLDGPWALSIAAGAEDTHRWSLEGSGYWYDFTVTADDFEQRFAGRMETGSHGISDPATI